MPTQTWRIGRLFHTTHDPQNQILLQKPLKYLYRSTIPLKPHLVWSICDEWNKCSKTDRSRKIVLSSHTLVTINSEFYWREYTATLEINRILWKPGENSESINWAIEANAADDIEKEKWTTKPEIPSFKST